MAGRASNLYMFEGTLHTAKEAAAKYTAVSAETVRLALKAGCNSIPDINVWLAQREANSRKALKINTAKTRKTMGVYL